MSEEVKPLSVWEVDGEDLIVARNERHMRQIYNHYHGESIRGREINLIQPETVLSLTDDGDDVIYQTAAEYAISPGYFQCRR